MWMQIILPIAPPAICRAIMDAAGNPRICAVWNSRGPNITPETVQEPDTNAPKTPSGGTMKGKALPIFATIVVLIWVIMLSRPELLRPEPSMICTIAMPLTRAMAMVRSHGNGQYLFACRAEDIINVFFAQILTVGQHRADRDQDERRKTRIVDQREIIVEALYAEYVLHMDGYRVEQRAESELGDACEEQDDRDDQVRRPGLEKLPAADCSEDLLGHDHFVGSIS